MINTKVITLDVDWASDEVIMDVAGLFVRENVKATWFITHPCEAVNYLQSKPHLFEIGLHPNFFAGSTQGKSYHEVMEYLLKIAPTAKSVRTHSLYQSMPLMKKLCAEYGLQNDSSIFLYKTPNVVPHELQFGEHQLVRLPYIWGDYTEFSGRQPNFDPAERFSFPGMKIFCFHPIHVAMNASNPAPYNNMKDRLKMTSCTIKELNPYINTAVDGARDFLMRLMKQIKTESAGGFTISETAELWKQTSRQA